MTIEEQENKIVPLQVYFDRPGYSGTRSTPLFNNPFDASTMLTMMLLLSTLIPVAYAQGANGGAYFRDIRGGLYYVTSRIPNITSSAVDLLRKKVCEAALEESEPKKTVMHLVADFCKRPKIGEGRPDPTTFIQIYSVGNTEPSTYFVECLKNFFTKSCYEYFNAEFNQLLRWGLPLSIGIILLLGFSFYYLAIRPADQRNRLARPVVDPNSHQLNNPEANPLMNAPTFQNRYKILEELLEAMKYEIQSLNEEKLSNEYQCLLSELNKFQESHSCPVHHDIMNIPTTLSSGITYDRISINDHLKLHNFCPLSKRAVPRTVPHVDVYRKNVIANSLKALEDKAKALRLSLDERKAIKPTETKQDSNTLSENELRHRPH